MDSCFSELPRFLSDNTIKTSHSSTIFTPCPIRNKFQNFAELILGSDEDIEKRIDRQEKCKDTSFSSSYLNKKLQSYSTILSFDRDLCRSSETESYLGSTEPNSPEKQINEDRDEGRDEGLNSESSFEDMIYELVPSRASNPHILDDYFERNILNDEESDSEAHESNSFDGVLLQQK